MIDAAFVIVTVAVAIATVLPFSRGKAWWIRSWDFPRLQLAGVALALVVAAAIRVEASGWVRLGVLAASAACLAYHTVRILPYTPLFPRQVAGAGVTERRRRLRLLVSNVQITNRRHDLLLGRIRECAPDVVVTLESDTEWERSLDALQPDYPHAVKHPLDTGYGMHVYSRLPLENSRVEFLVEPEVPSMNATVVLGSGHRVRAYFLHPAPPSPTEESGSEERDAELVIVAKRVARENGPAVVTGDLNDVAWSATTRLFRKLSGLLDPRIGRGFFNTFHARWFFIRWPLDHLFHSDEFTLVEMRRLRSVGSDHFPILVDLALKPVAPSEREARS